MGIRMGIRRWMGCSDIPVRRCNTPDVRQGERRDLLQREKNSAQ